jgi:hypothetical protein
MHVQSWQETYPGLLPDAEIAHRDMAYRTKLWTQIMGTGQAQVSILDDIGFALMGHQRDEALSDQFPRELMSLYVLQSAHGTGAGLALLDHVTSYDTTGFSACVLKGNVRATQFYLKSGGRFLKDVTDLNGYADSVFGWSVPIQLWR